MLDALGAGNMTRRLYKSKYEILSSIYPHYEWLPWKFSKLPSNVGQNPRVVSSALEYCKTELNLKSPEDWYRISKSQLNSVGVYEIIRQNGGVVETLKRHLPGVTWDESKFLFFYKRRRRLDTPKK